MTCSCWLNTVIGDYVSCSFRHEDLGTGTRAWIVGFILWQ